MIPSRREFFSRLTAAAALPATWTAFTQSLQAAPTGASPGSEDYWQLVSRQFPLEDGLLYCNAANVCPASRPVLDRHAQFLRDFHANPSFQNREKYEPMREALRRKVGAMLRVSPEEIAFTRNTSEGSNIIVKGIDLKPGDEVIITDHNHPSNNDAWKVRAARDGFTVKTVAVPVPAVSSQALFDSIAQAVTPKTRVIAITQLTSTTGILYPAREIAQLARSKGIWMHLDGAQTFGALDVNLQEIGCDSFSASAHKWLMGPLEAGVLFIREERIAATWPSIVTAGWSDHLKGARKFEVFGQRDDPRIASLEGAVDFIGLIGIANVEARVRHLAGIFKREVAEMPGTQLKTNLQPELSGGVVKVFLPKRDLKQAYDALWTRHRVATSLTPSGDSSGLRFSLHIYNTLDQVKRTAAALRDVAS